MPGSASSWSTSGSATAPTRASTATTRPTCATGSCRADVHVLVVNAGSSSMKLRLLDPHDAVVWTRDLEADDPGLHDALAEAGEADASGHRIVHGGADHRKAERVDDALVEQLRALTVLAPLHQPPALDALEAVLRARPGLP